MAITGVGWAAQDLNVTTLISDLPEGRFAPEKPQSFMDIHALISLRLTKLLTEPVCPGSATWE